ncbi:MAG: glycyl-radical enzyme activating protein [Bacteroidales bacterium]|nr:MAG: glycyl-radical enzyme activating protein [Bacteroidales bacterium]
MQGIIFDIKRFAVNDGPGIRTTVFFKGCPLECYWCHNPEGIRKCSVNIVKTVKLDGKTFRQNEVAGKVVTVKELMEIIRQDRIFMDESGGGVTFSGGEPTFQADFLLALLKTCRNEGIHTVVDTNGYAPEKVFKNIMPYVNIFLYDLKHLDPEKHLEGTGVSNDLILNNLKFLIKNGKSINIRIPVVPDFNFNSKDISAMLKLLNSYRESIDQINLLPYHTLAKNKYKRFGMKSSMNGSITGMKIKDLKDTKALFEERGFIVKVGG